MDLRYTLDVKLTSLGRCEKEVLRLTSKFLVFIMEWIYHSLCAPNWVEKILSFTVDLWGQERYIRASLVAQWLRVCLLRQGTQIRALVWEDPACRGTAGPVSHNYWACASGACALQRERPRQWEARAPRWRVAPTCHNWRKPLHRNEDPTQPKINK